MMKNRFLYRTLSILCSIALTSCSASESEEYVKEESKQSVFRLYYASELETLNYLQTNNWNETAVFANLVDCLVDYDSYGNIMPGLAESWSHNDDLTEWTFNIRKGVKWVDYNGKEYCDVTADDWVTTAEYVNNAKNQSTCQYMYSTGSIIKNAQAYFDYTEYMMLSNNGKKDTDDDGNPLEPVEEVKASDIGVTALDDYTLVYTLEQPCSFFLSVLSYPSFMPVNRDFLEKSGDMFGLDNKNLLYNGAFIFSYYQPQEKHILSKNQSYWDKQHVYIDQIQREYNIDAYNVQGDMFLNGTVDYAMIGADVLENWLQDDKTKNLVHSTRTDTAYSYFYAFNFDPNFDSKYEPDNWKIVVANENFRQSLVHALNRTEAVKTYEPYNPDKILTNTVTPKNFTFADGLDFTDYEPLKKYSQTESFNADLALEYKKKALSELKKAGATFPVKVLMPFNPSILNWEIECQKVEKQMEELLGTDYIDIIVEAGPDVAFLSSVRRTGKYAFMKCNWGADYNDPLTYAEPFTADRDYIFWDKIDSPEVHKIFTQWQSLVEEGSFTYSDAHKRYQLFAQAESLLIEHAIIQPLNTSIDEGYVVSKLNFLEGEYSPNGIASQRYKFMKIHSTSMSMEERNKLYEQWQKERDESIKKANNQ